MGWLFWNEPDTRPATRKQIVLNHFNCDEPGNGKWDVVHISSRGTTFYLAIKHTNYSTGDSNIFGVVVLTAVDPHSFANFGIKPMDESMGPHYYEAPEALLRLLSPTTSEFALEWRQKCRDEIAKNAELRRLRRLPLGTKIHLNNGQDVIVYENRGKRVFKLVDKWAKVTGSHLMKIGYTMD